MLYDDKKTELLPHTTIHMHFTYLTLSKKKETASVYVKFKIKKN